MPVVLQQNVQTEAHQTNRALDFDPLLPWLFIQIPICYGNIVHLMVMMVRNLWIGMTWMKFHMQL